MTAQPITGLGKDAIQACNAVKTPYKKPADAQNDRRGEGKDFSGSFA